MKRKITLLFAAAFGIFTSNAQTTLSESFTATFVPSASGWNTQNVSVPSTTVTWSQGNPSNFPANSGAPADYFGANFNSTTGAGTISQWLLTPTLSLTNGAILKFATRTTTASTIYPDRLQVRLSLGTGTAVGTGSTSVGTFTTLLLDINPLYSTSTTSAVSGNTVNGFPDTWSVYTLTLSSITGTVQGRVGFRYFVEDGGPTGNNSDYIGLDDVNYSLPCATPTLMINPPSASFCSGGSATFFGSGATTYTWSTGVTTASVGVSPTVTTIYTLMGSSTPGCTSSKTVAVTVTLTPVVAVSNVTTCPSTSSTLTASGASTYSWNTGALTPAIVVSPAATTSYTVTGNNGICANTKTVTVTIGTGLSIIVTSSSASICPGKSATLTVSGATTYTWLPTGSGSSIVVSPTTAATYTVAGQTGGCFGVNTIAVGVNSNPVLSGSSTPSIGCTNSTVSILGSGATNYTWSIGSSSVVANPVTLTTGSVAGTTTLTLTGTNLAGCTATISYVQTTTVCSVGLTNSAIETTNVAIYPNPFTNEVTILGVNGPIEVINTLGQVVLTATVSEKETINTTNLAKGIYFIKVKSADTKSIQTIKVIKN